MDVPILKSVIKTQNEPRTSQSGKNLHVLIWSWSYSWITCCWRIMSYAYQNVTSIWNFLNSQHEKTQYLIWNIQRPSPSSMKTRTSAFLTVLERGDTAATTENCWGLLCEGKKTNWKLYVSLKPKINKYLTPSVCICTYCEICFKELKVQLGNHSCLLLFEIYLVFPVQLHLCVKLSPPGNLFCLP